MAATEPFPDPKGRSAKVKPRDWNAFTPKLVTALREGYGFQRFRADFVAGLTVAVIALPLAMALGIASGASPDKGLLTAIVAGFLISTLGGSRTQIGGPTGAFVVVVFNVIAAHGYDGLVLATFMAGLILVVAGYCGAGRIIRFIPHPVVTGFTAGIAVIIASSQVKDFLGLRMAQVPADFLPKWGAILRTLDTIDKTTFALGLASLLLIVILRRWAPRLPAFLLAVVAGGLAAALLHLPVDTIGSRFPHMQTGIPVPSLPAFSLARVQEVAPSAFTIAFLAGIESLLSAMVADGMTGFHHRSGQELVGQGIANLASSLFGGLPATGAIARTAANIKAGGRTPVAGICHALFLLLFVLFASRLMAMVPMAVLAAILFVVAWGMSEARRFLVLLRMPIGERTILLLTFLLTILVDLTVAIGVGITLASLIFMARMSESGGFSGSEGGEEHGENPTQRDNLPTGVEVFAINGPFFFGVAGSLLEALNRVGKSPKCIILRLEQVPFLDSSGALALHEFLSETTRAGIAVIISGIRPKLLDMLAPLLAAHPELQPGFAGGYEEALALAAGRKA
jgi:sulfate permease, SulP family